MDRHIILETVVGQVRVCAFSAFWLGATTLQTAFCKDEGVPLEHRKRQRVEKARNRTCSALTKTVNCLAN